MVSVSLVRCKNCTSKASLGAFTLLTSRFWSYHLHLREKSWSFSFTKRRNFLVGSAHVRSQATVHAFMHAEHAVCMRAEDIDTRFKERVASSPEVPKVTWWKIATFLRLPFTLGAFTLLTIATFWSYHLHLREKSRSFSFTKLRNFLVGSAHVRSQATVHAFMHAVCMRAEDIDTHFKERA